MQFKALAVLAIAGSAVAQRPSDTPICDYYTTALLKDNTPANQYKLLTLLVNTVAIGNYTQPNVGVKVPGILAPGNVNGTAVNLAPYFTGALKSSNRNGVATSVNFLDGGGATPLMKNEMPPQSSNQYKLVTHLYQYFGVLLGCTGVGKDGFPNYAGDASQAKVHRFMNLDQYQMYYFIEQVGMAAASFGVTQDDVTAVGMSLTKAFDYRCSPPAVVVPSQGSQLQSMCQADTCPLDPKAMCNSYPNNGVNMEPMMAATNSSSSNSTSSMGSSGSSGNSGSSSSSGSSSNSASMPKATNGASTLAGGLGALAAAGVAAVFVL